MKVEAENNDVKREENNNDNNNNNNNNESNNKIRNSSEGLSKPKRQMKMSFQLEMLEKAYAGLLSLTFLFYFFSCSISRVFYYSLFLVKFFVFGFFVTGG